MVCFGFIVGECSFFSNGFKLFGRFFCFFLFVECIGQIELPFLVFGFQFQSPTVGNFGLSKTDGIEFGGILQTGLKPLISLPDKLPFLLSQGSGSRKEEEQN